MLRTSVRDFSRNGAGADALLTEETAHSAESASVLARKPVLLLARRI